MQIEAPYFLGTQSAFVGQANVTDSGKSSSFTFIMPTEQEILDHEKLTETPIEFTFTFETFQLYILCELMIAARNRERSCFIHYNYAADTMIYAVN